MSSTQPEHKYTIILVTPGFGTGDTGVYADDMRGARKAMRVYGQESFTPQKWLGIWDNEKDEWAELPDVLR